MIRMILMLLMFSAFNHWGFAKYISVYDFAERGDLDSLKAVFSSQPLDVNKKDKSGETLLMKSASGGHLAMVRWLLSKGAKIDQTSFNGETALFQAVSEGHFGVVATLLDQNPSLKIQYGENKETILFEATRTGNLKIIQKLIEADPSLVNSLDANGENAGFVAVRNYQSKALSLLLDNKLNLHRKSYKGQAMQDLSEASYSDEVRRLLKISAK